MAIINSLAIGKSVKSAGNLTYKTVRGRTIASQRITSNKSNTMLQSIQRTKFRFSAQAAQLVQVFINSCYEKSKYGTARNNFMSINKNYDAFGVISEVHEGVIPIADVFVPAFSSSAETTSKILYSAFGSSPVITREEVTTNIYTDSAVNEFEFNATQKVEYALITPVLPEKCEIVVCGIFGDETNGLAKAQITSRSLNLSSENISKLKSEGYDIKTTLDDAGNVLSFTVEPIDAGTGEYEAYAVIFPRVGGKIPKLRGLMHVITGPLP